MLSRDSSKTVEQTLAFNSKEFLRNRRGNTMHEYQFTLLGHTRSTIKEHQRQAGNAFLGPAGQLTPLLQEVGSLSHRVDGFIQGFPKRVIVKKGANYRRLSIALLIYLGALVSQIWFFNGHNVFDLKDTAEIAKIIFRNEPDYALYGQYVYWAFVGIFSLLSMAVAFLGVMVLCLFLSVFRFKWVNSVFEALCTAAGSAGVTYLYYQYLPLFREQIDKILS